MERCLDSLCVVVVGDMGGRENTDSEMKVHASHFLLLGMTCAK
jgi:hypothetical protein